MNRPPDIKGPHSEAWTYDLETLRAAKKNHKDGTVAVWLIKAPWAHPIWHSYLLILLHLRPVEGLGEPRIYRPGATHEIVLSALNPNVSITVDKLPLEAMLQPLNFGGQFVAETDDAAEARVETSVREICEGKLSPDTDYTQSWVARYGSYMLKGDPTRAGETIIVTHGPNGITHMVIDPKDADAKPDTTPKPPV